jgi:hypothetical protein
MSTGNFVSECLEEELEAVEAILMDAISVVPRESISDKATGETRQVTRVIYNNRNLTQYFIFSTNNFYQVVN